MPWETFDLHWMKDAYCSTWIMECSHGENRTLVDPRKLVSLSHVTNIPGLMRVVHTSDVAEINC